MTRGRGVAARLLATAACAVASAAWAAPAAAQAVYWTDWTSRTLSSGTTAGSATGSLNVLGTPVTVSFSGELNSATQVSGGTNYWTGQRASFLGGVLTDAAPISSDIMAFDGGKGIANTITFSQAIVNPIFSFVSVGRSGIPVTLTFSSPFEIVAQGPGPFGSGTLTQNGSALTGVEGNGTIRFLGTFSQISWTSGQNGEFWGGFTMGVQGLGEGPVSTVPEPSTYALLASGLLGVAVAARRRRQVA